VRQHGPTGQLARGLTGLWLLPPNVTLPTDNGDPRDRVTVSGSEARLPYLLP
jgi:hypothetical protein